MHEPILHRKPSGFGDVIFELDFSGQDVGGTVLRDKVTGLQLQSVVSKPNGSIAQGVIDHPTYGRCFQFNGYSYAYGTGAISTLALNQIGNYQIDVEFATLSTALTCMFETGNYTTNIYAGSAIWTGYAPTQFLQYFQVTGVGNYQRSTLLEADPAVLRAYRIKRDLTGTEMRDVTTGVSNKYARFATGTDTHLWFGANKGTGAGAYYWKGLIKSFKISKV